MTNPHNDAGRKKALLIAVKSVRGFQPLHHAHRDALLFRDLLIGNFDYFEENVVLMMDDITLRSHLWPSRKNILEQITKMVAGASSNDCFFFYYSGHRSQMPRVDDTETDGVDEEVIFAYTGERIVDKTLKELLVTPLPRGSKLFAFWDSGRPVTYLEPSFSDPPSSSGTIPIADQQTPPRGRAEDPPSPLNGVKLIRPHSPPSWLAHMFPDSSPSAHPRSLSPISFFPRCMCNCQKVNPEDQQDAQVVSLSSGNDYVFDVETGGTFTKLFIECVSQDPKPSLFTLLRHIRDRMDQMHEQATDESMKYQGLKIYLQKPERQFTYLQKPKFTSRYPLDIYQLVGTIF